VDTKDRFFSKVDMSSGCWIWQGAINEGGYGIFWDNNKPIRAHRWSFKFFNGELNDDICVLHNCPEGDNPLCVNPHHLFLGTRADNIQDMVSKGRQNFSGPGAHKGEKHHLSVLSEGEVVEIRKIRESDKLSYQELATLFGVSKPTIQAIIKGFTWRHLL
jgi:DNA-binding XRE family transcriptional regulator